MKLRKVKRKSYFQYVLDILFPRRCVWCGRVQGFAKSCACASSLQQMTLPAQPLNLRAQGQLCNYLDAAWACFSYQPPVSDVIVRIKFEEEDAAAGPLGEVMAAKAVSCGLGEKYDMVVPVPVSAKTRKRRGYNQSALLARGVAGTLELACEENLLQKTKETQKQMDLNREERLLNVQDAYEVTQPQQLAGKRVLLVDDVLTTGATLNECAKTLLQAGAVCCGALCAAAVSKPTQ